jgi:hypothetical protein
MFFLWCPCFASKNLPPTEQESEEMNELLFSEKMEITFNEIGARRLDISVPRYTKLKKLCRGRSDILYKLHDEGFHMNMGGIEFLILRELACTRE